MVARRDETSRGRYIAERRLGTSLHRRRCCTTGMEPLSGWRDVLVAPVGALHSEAVVRAQFVKPPIPRLAGKVGLEPLNPCALMKAQRVSGRRGQHSSVQLI